MGKSLPESDTLFATASLSLAVNYRILANTKSLEQAIYSAKEVLKWTLTLASQIDIQSIPGNEWERLLQLQIDCFSVVSLLQDSPASMDIIATDCDSIIEEYCYLLELTNAQQAVLVERLCGPIRGGNAWATRIRLENWNVHEIKQNEDWPQLKNYWLT